MATIDANAFWNSFKQELPLKNYHKSVVSKCLTRNMHFFLGNLAKSYSLTALFSSDNEKKTNMADKASKQKEFLLDGIIYEKGIIDSGDFVRNILVGIEWQWDWGKSNDLLLWDFTKLLHVKMNLGVLLFYIHTKNAEEWQLKFLDAQRIVSSQLALVIPSFTQLLLIGIKIEKVNKIWPLNAEARAFADKSWINLPNCQMSLTEYQG